MSYSVCTQYKSCDSYSFNLNTMTYLMHLQWEPDTDIATRIEELFHSCKTDAVYRERITFFLTNNPELITYVNEGYNFINQLTEKKRDTCLWLFSDPEDGSETLIIQVKTNLEVEEASRLNHDIYKGWFKDLPDEIKNLLLYEEIPVLL